LSEALMTPIRHRLSSLGLDRSSADHRGVILDFDQIKADIESLTPNKLRAIIIGLRPKLDKDFELTF